MSDPNRMPPKPDAPEWLTRRSFLLLLAAALIVAFPKVVLGLHTFVYRDFAAYCYPLNVFSRDAFLSGQLPLWNPYSECGLPHLAQLGQWYPPVLLALFLPMPWSINFLMLAHLVWGGAGMYWLVKRWGAGSFAAGFAGIAYVFNGLSLSCLTYAIYIAALSWIPWIVGCTLEAWKTGGRWLVAAAIAAAFQILAGLPELTMLTWMLLGALWINALVIGECRGWLSLKRTVLIALLAAGLTLFQTLPFLDLVMHSQRNQGSDTGAWSMPGWGLANLIVPLFHCYRAPQGPWFQPGQDLFSSYYLGAGVLALGVAGAWLARARFTAAILGMTVFCWVMAMGSHSFVYSWVKHVFPVMGFARYPIKFVLLTAFLVPLLAAQGVQYIETRANRRTNLRPVCILATMLLLMLALVWVAREHPFPGDQWHLTAANAFWRAILMLVLAGGVLCLRRLQSHAARIAVQLVVLAVLPLDALTHSPDIAPTLPSAVLAPGLWQASGRPPPPKLGEGRVMISPDAEQRFLYSRVPNLETDLTAKRLAEWYNFNLLDRVPKVNGAIPLHSAYFELIEERLYYAPGSRFGHGLLDFLSVAWFSAPDNPAQWLARTNFLPVITAGQKPLFADDKKTLSAITADDFAPREVVYLPETERSRVTVTNHTLCTLTNARFSLNQVEVDAHAAARSLVVLSQSYYHLWRAFVDGRPVPLLRANLAFQAIEVPAGMHHVKFIYRDPYLEIGAVISVLSLSLCGLIRSKAKPR